MSTCENFWYFLHKLKERLIIITEYNLQNRIDNSVNDEWVLYDLFKIHEDNDLLTSLKRSDILSVEVSDGNDSVSEEE